MSANMNVLATPMRLRFGRRAFLAGAAALVFGAPAKAAGPQRIVSAGSDVTETVVALAGLGVVRGVDITSRTPPEVRALPSIGYLRQISVEGIVSLKPDLIIANRDLGPPLAIEQLRGLGLKVELISGALNASGMAEKIRHIGTIVGAADKAEPLAATVMAAMTDLAKRLEGIEKRPRVAFLRSFDGGRPIAAGKLPLVDAVFDLAGGVNAFPDFTLFKPVSKEVLAASPPDVIVADAETVKASGGAAAIMEGLGLGAADPSRFLAIDATTLFAFGPSGANEMTTLAKRLHPERFKDNPP
jgi:iron complex transport system substrate-binding protein